MSVEKLVKNGTIPAGANPYYVKHPSMYKLIQLLNTQNLREVYNLGKYIGLAMYRRRLFSA